MEYNGPEEEDDLYDTSKLEYINKMGEEWISKDCARAPNPGKCEKLQGISIAYGSEYIKIRDKLENCHNLLDEVPEYSNGEAEYDRCMMNSTRAFSFLVDDFYSQFKNTQQAP